MSITKSLLIDRYAEKVSKIKRLPATTASTKYSKENARLCTRAGVSLVTRFCQKFSWQVHWQVGHTTAAVQPGKKNRKLDVQKTQTLTNLFLFAPLAHVTKPEPMEE